MLAAELVEARERMADRAEAVVREALYDRNDASRRDGMARFVLANVGRHRGYGSGPGETVSIKTSGTVVISWADGAELTNE